MCVELLLCWCMCVFGSCWFFLGGLQKNKIHTKQTTVNTGYVAIRSHVSRHKDCCHFCIKVHWCTDYLLLFQVTFNWFLCVCGWGRGGPASLGSSSGAHFCHALVYVGTYMYISFCCKWYLPEGYVCCMQHLQCRSTMLKATVKLQKRLI